MLAVLLALGFVVILRRACGRRETRERLKLLESVGELNLHVKLKIIISLWQILQGMGAVFAIPIPPFTSRL